MVICVLFHLTILYKTSYKRFTVRGTIRAEPEYLGLEGGGTSGFGRNHPRPHGESCFPVNGVLETDTASRMAPQGTARCHTASGVLYHRQVRRASMKLLSCLRTALCLLGVLAMPAAAAYPEKPINMIIAFTAGGSSDVQARIMQKY